MKTLYENKNNPELNIVQTSDTEVQGMSLAATDVGVGFIVKLVGQPAGRNKELFIDDELLKVLHELMLNRKE